MNCSTNFVGLALNIPSIETGFTTGKVLNEFKQIELTIALPQTHFCDLPDDIVDSKFMTNEFRIACLEVRVAFDRAVIKNCNFTAISDALVKQLLLGSLASSARPYKCPLSRRSPSLPRTQCSVPWTH